MSSATCPLAVKMSSRPSLSASKKKHAKVSDSSDVASEAGRRRIVDEQPVALVAIERQHLVGEVADQQAGPPGSIEVGRVHAHAGARHARFVEGHAGGDRFVHERALAGVAIEPVRLRVVGHEHVEPAVRVVVEQADAEALAGGIVQARPSCHVLERAVAAVVEQERRLALVALGRAVRLRLAVERAVDVLLDLPLARSWRRSGRDGRPCRSRTTPRCWRSRRRPTPARCVTSSKAPLPVLRNRRLPPSAGHEQVHEPVVVVVGGRARPSRTPRTRAPPSCVTSVNVPAPVLRYSAGRLRTGGRPGQVLPLAKKRS